MRKCFRCGTILTINQNGTRLCSVKCRIAFGSVVNQLNGCTEWHGAIGSHGYGVLKTAKSTDCVHRLVYEMAHGPIPRGMYVMHKCDNRRCVALEHLILGTPHDNSADMTQKGRHWIKGKKLPEDYRRRLRVPKKTHRWQKRDHP